MRLTLVSLPPFKHTRNPALEKEDDFRGSGVASAPLITHNGVVEKRRTTDRKLIRTHPSDNDVEFEYLPVFSGSTSTLGPSKSRTSKVPRGEASNERTKNENDCPTDRSAKKKLDLPLDVRTETSKDQNNARLEKESTESVKNVQADQRHCKSCRCSVKRETNVSPKSNISTDSLTSRKSARSSSTVTSVASTIKNANIDKRGRRVSSTVDFRYVANGLDREDQFPRRRI